MSRLHYDSNDRDDGNIKRCPFCGGIASVRMYSPPFLYDSYYYVLCDDCWAMSEPNSANAKRAIENWNRRVKQ